jgi:hypothetical protein
MSNYETEQELSIEYRLKAIAYQFIALYERWSEDRQVAAKQGADTAELVKQFSEQVKSFKELEPKVRREFVASIQSATSSAFEKIGETIGKEATRATEQVTNQLTKVTEKAERTLTKYESELIANLWKIIGATVVSSIVASFLIVWLLIPRPTLPLTDNQIKDLRGGQLMDLVWPKLSKQEQQHWHQLADNLSQNSDNDNTGDSNN